MNVSAHAIMSVAHAWNGDWNSWSLLMESVLDMEPRSEYQDYDALFLAYAHFYRDHEAAGRKFDILLADKPTWIVPQALRAAAWSHSASIHGRKDYAKKALDILKGPEAMAAENPVVMITGLCVYMPAILILGDEDGTLKKKSEAFVARLSQNPKNPIAAHVCALYWQTIGDRPGHPRHVPPPKPEPLEILNPSFQRSH